MKSGKWKRLLNRQNTIILLFVVVSLICTSVPYFKFDLLVSEKIQSINSVVFEKIMWFVSSIGNQPFMIFIVTTFSLLLYLFKFRAEAVISSLSAAGSALSGSLIKTLVDRPRPDAGLVNVSVWLSDKSYPSNHVLVFTVYFGFLLYFLMKRPKRELKETILFIIFVLLIATIGISRIYLGAHWASDVLGGYLLGVLWLILTIWFYNSYHGKR
ncbi:MAG: phosphatase PAP2 family protein [Microgenomates group bacterium]